MKSFLPMALTAFVLAGCVDQKAWIQKFVPKDDDIFARQFVELVKNKRYDEAKAMLTADIRGQAESEFQKMQPVIDHGAPQSFETIGCFTTYFTPWGGKPVKKVSLTYQLHFADTWALVEMVVQSSNDGRYVAGAHFYQLPNSLEVINRFTFENKTPIHYLFFAACVFVPVFIVITLVVSLFSRVRLRWLWVIFILFGVTQFQMNWTTGQIGFRPIGFLVLGASFFRAGLYAPIVFSFGIPLGAILFLVLRRWLLRNDEPPAQPTTTASA